MCAWSYLWDSQKHLSNAAFALELSGAVIEVIVAIVIVATFHKEWDEKIKKRLEYLFEVAFLVAAIIMAVAIISNRRIDTLREKDEKAAEDEINTHKEEAQAAANTAAAASDKATAQAEKLSAANAKVAELQGKVSELDAKTQPRTISEENKQQFIKSLENVPRGNVEVYINGNSGPEVQNYAEQIRQMCGSAGYDVAKMCGQVFGGGKIPQGIGIGVRDAANHPPFAEPIQHAFETIGIDAVGYIDARIGTNSVRIFVGSKP